MATPTNAPTPPTNGDAATDRVPVDGVSAKDCDVLIVTALKDELEGILEIGKGGRHGWTPRRDSRGFPYHYRVFEGVHFAAAWLGEMGEMDAAVRSNELIGELKPQALAMCGICAGDRRTVSLGDIVIAERVYSYDTGKLNADIVDGLYQDIKTYNLKDQWRVDATYFADDRDLRRRLTRGRPVSLRYQMDWLLRRLLEYATSGDPDDYPYAYQKRKAHCPAWTVVVDRLQKKGWISCEGEYWSLTTSGMDEVQNLRARHPEGVARDPPFAIRLGAMATGKAVQRDPALFPRLERSIRKTLAVEMESAAIGYVAARNDVRMFVAKAVVDFGDYEKDDSFRKYACRVSAQFVHAFLLKQIAPRTGPSPSPTPDGEPADPQAFSACLAAQLRQFHTHVARLTTDQFQIIQFLSGHLRVSIQGCAGSGKTLVAVEKAIRLARAGLRVLLLCHNPALAERLRALSSGTNVVVRDFGAWVNEVIGQVPGVALDLAPREEPGSTGLIKAAEGAHGEALHWSNYEEPGSEDLERAFSLVQGIYDAVIVDEGQDFREEWWALIEAALVAPKTGILYIFSDNNQSLLVGRHLPATERAPFTLSRNCRNAGAVFELARRLHPCAPEPEVSLAGGRVLGLPLLEGADPRTVVARAAADALRSLNRNDLIVLTTEPDPASSSILEGTPVYVDSGLEWQPAVRDAVAMLMRGAKRSAEHARQGAALPVLSSQVFPTDADVESVRAFVRRCFREDEIHPAHRKTMPGWRVINGKLELYPKPSVGSLALAALLGWHDWREGLPIDAEPHIITSDPRGPWRRIRLSTVSAFKGLEADAVILFVREQSLLNAEYLRDNARATRVYVGVTRAHFALSVVASLEVLDQLRLAR